MKMFKFEWKRSGSSNVYVLLQKWESIRMLEFVWKLRNRSEYWNLRTIGNQSKCWNLSANRQNLSKCWYLSEKLKNNQKVDVSVQ